LILHSLHTDEDGWGRRGERGKISSSDGVAVRVLVGVKEEHLLVGGHGPEVRGALALSRVDGLARSDHGLQTQDARKGGLLVVVALVVHLGEAVLDGLERGGHALGVLLGLLDGGDDLLLEHVDEAAVCVCVRSDLGYQQKRPGIPVKETWDTSKRDLRDLGYQ